MSDKVWITWETQRRNVTLSRELGAELFVFDAEEKNRALRYLRCLWRTVGVIRKERPRLLFAQNPSLVLALFSVLYGKIFGLPVVIDAHNAGLLPFGKTRGIMNKVSELATCIADCTIVTNDRLAKLVVSRRGRPFVLPDPLPDFDSTVLRKESLPGTFNILYICTYAGDEPYEEVIESARALEKDIFVHITGDYKKVRQKIGKNLPVNVVLTGFMPEARYLNMLYSVDLVIVLTNRDDCLLCGAYEAVSMEKPIVISDTLAIRRYFSKGAVYTDNSAADLGRKILFSRANLEALTVDVKKLKTELLETWKGDKVNFLKILEDLERTSHS